ncbi:MAG TPA: hypothetical protein VGL92_11750 [Acidimicrobiia bacterium]|jgi:hypothetical protein
MEAVPEVRRGRLARRVARSRRQRRLVAALLAVVGASATIAALTFRPASESAGSTRTAGSTAEPAGAVTGDTVGKPPSTAPGGVGTNPGKTGLPAVPAQGGEVRTGSADEGCFDNVRAYLEQWDKTGIEPDPCFTSQPASNQDQPDGVQRTYNGERF